MGSSWQPAHIILMEHNNSVRRVVEDLGETKHFELTIPNKDSASFLPVRVNSCYVDLVIGEAVGGILPERVCLIHQVD